MARSIREEPAVSPSTKASKLPVSLDALVMGMLAKFPSGRPDRMAAVTSILDRIATELLGGRTAEGRIAALGAVLLGRPRDRAAYRMREGRLPVLASD
jgi:hypothetical protein